MKIEKISSLHDDVYMPAEGKDLGEYKSWPERFDPSEKSVRTRLSQFGFDLEELEEQMGKKVSELSWEEYDSLISESIKGNYDVVVASVFDKFFYKNAADVEEGRRLEQMLGMIKRYEGLDVRFGVNLIKSKQDFKEDGNLVLALEAGAHLIKSVTDARKLASEGIRVFGLQYGKESTLSSADGLTDLGRRVVKDLMENNLIIDLAHSSYKTRQQVCEIAKVENWGHLVSYTHGSNEEDIIDSWKDKIGERPLKQAEICDIIKMGGIIGLGVSKPFFENTRKVAERIDAIAQLAGGIDRVAIGTDFGGVAPEWINEIRSPHDFKILADILSKSFGMKDEEINKVLRNNAKDWIRKAIN